MDREAQFSPESGSESCEQPATTISHTATRYWIAAGEKDTAHKDGILKCAINCGYVMQACSQR